MLYQIKSQISSLCKQELPFVCPRKANLCGTRKEQKKRNSLKAVLWKCCTHQDSQSGFQHRRQMRAVWSFWICSSVVSASLPSSNTKHPKGFMFTGAALAPLHSKPPPPFSWQEYSCGLRSSSRIFPGRPSHPRRCRGSACAIGLSFCATPLCRGGVSVLGRAAPPSHRVPWRILPGLGSCRRMFALGRGFCVFAVRKKNEERFLPFGDALAEF